MANDEVQRMVDLLAEELQRSVVIDDPAVHMLYSSPHYGDEDPVRVQAVLRRDAGSKAIGHVLAQGVSTWTTAGVIPASDEIGMKARVCVPLRWRGEMLGLLIVMDGDGTLTTTELARITVVAQDLSPVMAAGAGEDGQLAASREHLVADLISREPVVRRRALADLAADGESERFATVTAVEFAIVGAGSGSAIHGETALRNALTTRYRPGPADQLHAITADLGLLLLGGPLASTEAAARQHAEQVLQRVRDLSAGRFGCVAGVGSTVRGLDRASETAQHARLARRAASSVLDTAVASWGELGAYGPLLRIPDDELELTALPEELRRVLDVDHDHHFTETLRAYLDHAGAGPAASDALHIHRTTLYYRLRQISDLTGLDLADGRTRLVLHLGLTMLDVIEARRRG